MTDSFAFGNKEAQRRNIKNSKKIIDGFRRKEKTAAIFFHIEKTYNKINRKKKF